MPGTAGHSSFTLTFSLAALPFLLQHGINHLADKVSASSVL